jgi:hypothetical protein
MEWSLSVDKKNCLISIIDSFLAKKTCSLSEKQKLHGKLSDFAQACAFMKGFRSNILALLRKFGTNDSQAKLIPSATKKDLHIWKNCILEASAGFPLGEIFENPPIFPVSFVTDAAGAAWEVTENGRVNCSVPNDRGAAAVGHCKGKVTAVARVLWPKSFILSAKSSERKFYSSKSATLETIGLLLPFLAFPTDLAGRHVLLEVDNLSVVYAWEKRYSKTDPETSLLIRCLHVLEAFLCCKIYVKHLRRVSNRMAFLADSLSREQTITAEVTESVCDAKIVFPKGALTAWLKAPGLDWDLPLKLVSDVETLLNVCK